ncbi:MAG: hypothetical protein ACHREM_05720 [Polyangiales bacterium]
MQNPKNGLVVRLKIKDDRGNVVDEVDAVSYKGLLSRAHEEGLKSTETKLLQMPTEENRQTAIVHAIVCTKRGTFTGIGDANPANVNRRIAPHVVRMAETRAIARALRVAVNIGEVAIEELGENASYDADDRDASSRDDRRDDRRDAEPRDRDREPAPDTDRGDERPRRPPPRFTGRDTSPTNVATGDRRAMSEEQRKLLFRLAFDLGFSKDNVREKVLNALGVERLEWAERKTASAAIDALRQELGERQAIRGDGAAAGGDRRG